MIVYVNLVDSQQFIQQNGFENNNEVKPALSNMKIQHLILMLLVHIIPYLTIVL